MDARSGTGPFKCGSCLAKRKRYQKPSAARGCPGYRSKASSATRAIKTQSAHLTPYRSTISQFPAKPKYAQLRPTQHRTPPARPISPATSLSTAADSKLAATTPIHGKFPAMTAPLYVKQRRARTRRPRRWETKRRPSREATTSAIGVGVSDKRCR